MSIHRIRQWNLPLFLISVLSLTGCGGGLEINLNGTPPETEQPANDTGGSEASQGPFQITAQPYPENAGTLSGAGEYDAGENVTLIATAKAGFRFIRWKEGEDSVGTEPTLTFSANAARNLTAIFEPIRHTISLNVGPGGSVLPGDPVDIGHGETPEYRLTPDPGFDIGKITGCAGQLEGNRYLLDPVLTDCTLTIRFTQRTPEDPGAVDPGDGEPPSNEAPSGPITDVTDQLRELGLPVDETLSAPRRMNETLQFEDLPPLGAELRLAPRELFLLGQLRRGRPVSTFLEIYDEDLGTIQPKGRLVRHEDTIQPYFIGPIPDGSGTHPGSQFARAAAAGDFDGDGRQEVVLFHTWPNPNATPTKYPLEGILIEDDIQFTGPIDLVPAGYGGLGPAHKTIRDLEVLAGEMNGDEHDDILVVFLKDDWFGLLAIPGRGNNQFDWLSSPAANPILLDPTDGTRSIEIAQGNLDTDAPLETVVLVRTWNATLEGGEPSGSAHYYIFDDFSADENHYQTRLIAEGELRLPDYDGNDPVNPVTAGLAIADFNGDSLDEIAFTGLTRMRHQDCLENHYGILLLNNLPNGLEVLQSHSFAAAAPNCAYIYEVMARPLQIDKDYRKELLVNEFIIDFDTPDTLPTAKTPAISFFENTPFSHYSHALATADVDNDGRDEVISYTLEDGVLRMRGVVDQELAENVKQDGALPPPPFELDVPYTNGSIEQNPGPLILPYDNDDDGQILRYVPGSHTVMLSAPIIHAVLAAPPCSEALGQDMSNCSTTSGTDNTTGQENSSTVTASTSASVGVVAGYGIGPLTFEASVTATLEAWASQTTGSGYELSYSLDYTTYGQDAVLFSSIPYDVYQYEILQSAMNPEQVGQNVAFMYPRRPITRLVSVDYYNERVPPDGLRIDSSILQHTNGDIGSYLTLAEKNALRMAIMQSNPGNPYAFLEHGPIDVGGSNTDVTLSIALTETTFAEQSFGVGMEFSLETTAGFVIRNFSVGMEASNSMTVSMSETSRFSGTVTGIDDDNDVYSFGMFTYMGQAAPVGLEPQRFQVINYWVQ